MFNKIIVFCDYNRPKKDYFYPCLAAFSLILLFLNLYYLGSEAQKIYKNLINFLYPTNLVLSTSIMAYPIWLKSMQKWRYTGVICYIAGVYCLIFSNIIFLIMHLS